MSRRGEQLGLWQQGDEMTLPASRSFLLALREACDQALRKRGEAA